MCQYVLKCMFLHLKWFHYNILMRPTVSILMHNPSLQKHILSWSQLLDIGEDLPESRLDDRLKRLAINHCCTLVYDTPEKESSAPGPRGGMLTHDNLTWCSKMVSE